MPSMVGDLSTRFIGRLQAREAGAWFEMWEIFGPVVEAQLGRWGKGRLSTWTVRDLSQDTLAALAQAIDRHDPSRGARFSTWLLAIARHVMTDEFSRRNAQKRGSGKTASSLDENLVASEASLPPDEEYEAAIFRSKVEAAVRAAEHEVDFLEFEVFRQRIVESRSGKQVAESLGISASTVTRRLQRVRDVIQARLVETVARFSFTEDEEFETARNGLEINPKKRDDQLFDETLGEILRCQEDFRRRALDASQHP